MGKVRCTATVAVNWKGRDVTVTVESDELEETLRQADQALRKLKRRGAERPERYILAVGRVIPEAEPAGRWHYPGGQR